MLTSPFQENGYIQIAPLAFGPRTRAGKNDPRKAKPLPQNAHRLVVIAHKRQAPFSYPFRNMPTYLDHALTTSCRSEDDVARLLAGQHASHLCHQPTCINRAHIVVEPKERNEARKACRALGPIIKTMVDGREVVLPPNGSCGCLGEKCIFMIEWRQVAN